MKRKSNTLIMFLIAVSPLVLAELWSLFGVEDVGAVYYVQEESRLVSFVEASQIDNIDRTGL